MPFDGRNTSHRLFTQSVTRKAVFWIVCGLFYICYANNSLPRRPSASRANENGYFKGDLQVLGPIFWTLLLVWRCWRPNFQVNNPCYNNQNSWALGSLVATCGFVARLAGRRFAIGWDSPAPPSLSRLPPILVIFKRPGIRSTQQSLMASTTPQLFLSEMV